MDREHIKGTAEKAKGAIKDTAGKVTGDKKLQSEGKLDKAKGSAHSCRQREGISKAQQRVRNAAGETTTSRSIIGRLFHARRR
jgi:uncharacterized protein YjbJ (UPF0337 family)